MTSIIILLFLGLIAWFWMNSIRAKEIALQAAAAACKDIGAQFLDQTASLKKLHFIRNQAGRLSIERCYSFDFSQDRETRQQGLVIIKAYQVTQVLLEDASGSTIL